MEDEMVVAESSEGLEPEVEETAEPTPESTEGVAEATPEASSGDALAKLTEDINRMKSAQQKREYMLHQQHQAEIAEYQRRMLQYEEQMYQYQTQGLTPEQKAEYDYQRELQKRDAAIQEMQARMQEYESERVAAQRQQQAIEYFAHLGVPRDKLVEHADHPANLTKFARDYITELAKRATQAPPTPGKVTKHPTAASSTSTLEKWKRGELTPDEIEAYQAKVMRGEPLT